MSRAIQLRRVDTALRRDVARIALQREQHVFVSPLRDVLARAAGKPHLAEFAILEGEQVVGYFQLNFSRAETAHFCSGEGVCGLESMAVDRRRQGCGIGSAALGLLPTLAMREYPALRHVNLTVNVANANARRAYLRAGFEDTGQIYEGGPNGPQNVLSMDLRRVVRGRVWITVLVWLQPGEHAAFRRYEAAAMPLMARHGGRRELTLHAERAEGDLERPDEVHLLSFSGDRAFASFRSDPELLALAPLRERGVKRVVLLTGRCLDSAGPT